MRVPFGPEHYNILPPQEQNPGFASFLRESSVGLEPADLLIRIILLTDRMVQWGTGIDKTALL